MRTIVAIFFMLTVTRGYAQCTSGNCIAGTGTFNYGWCVYTGEFKNGKPEGKGVMKYDDYTYMGPFVNGLEEGEGVIINKDGSRENASYQAGKKVVSQLERIAPGDYKPLTVQNIRCISGDCITGFGTFQFDSGGKYTGYFKDRQFDGQGKFEFANGDKFEGNFHDNEKVSGVYRYFTGAVYRGNYDSRGMEYNGTITSPGGFSIPYVNGSPVIPPTPAIPLGADLRGDQSQKEAPSGPVKISCSVCFGSGVQRHVEDWSGPTSTHLVSVSTPCYKCHGTGYELY